MATTIRKEEILKAAQAMTKDERLKLIAEIAALPDEENLPRMAETVDASPDLDEKVMKTARQFMDEHSDLLRRLAE